MKIEAQEYLKIIKEAKHGLVFFDIEASGLRGDYNSTLCVSFKPYGQKPYTFQVEAVGNDQKLVRIVRDELKKYHVWCGYYSKGFDKPFLNTRLLKWGLEPMQPKHHIDMYYTLKYNTLMSRRSMAQYAGLLECHDQKMGVSPNVWSEMPFNMKKHMPMMVSRCESDCAVLEGVFEKTQHLIKDITKG